MNRVLLTVLALATLTALAPAQQPSAQPTEVSIRPAPEPSPALKYHLLPWPHEQHPGNAAIHYHRASLLSDNLSKEVHEKLGKLDSVPSANLPQDEVRTLLRSYRQVLQEVELAARSERCDWQMSEAIRRDGVSVLLPEVQRQREFAQVLKLKVRLEIAQGRYDDAVATLRTGFALARHQSEMPTIISALVAVAISSVMANEAESLMQAPGAPNLYWALTELPRPFIDMREAFQTERYMVDTLFPGLRELLNDPKAPPLTPQQVEALLKRMARLPADELGKPRLDLAAVDPDIARMYPEARRFLIARGRTAQQVDAMPKLQALFLFQLGQYDQEFDNLVKWQGMPYWQARSGVQRAARRIKQEREKTTGFAPTLVVLMIPAVEKVLEAQVRLDRKLAALCCIEALRMYAAAHDGKLPTALADITEVPVPFDPVTGKSFEYHRTDDGATLASLPWPGHPAGPINRINYRLLLKP